MTDVRQQALDALLSFSRSARVEGRAVEGFHRLGESPEDMGYGVKITLSVRHDPQSKSYRVQLSISEERYEGGFAASRHGFGMPSRELESHPATRFSAKAASALYAQVLKQLTADMSPLISLLQEESERS